MRKCGFVLGIFLFAIILTGFVPMMGQAPELCGIGAEVKSDGQAAGKGDPIIDHALVVKIMPGGAGEKAGVKKDDEIIQVDDTKVAGMTLIDVVTKLIRGPKDTSVKLVIRRATEKEPITITVVRAPMLPSGAHL